MFIGPVKLKKSIIVLVALRYSNRIRTTPPARVASEGRNGLMHGPMQEEL